MHQRAAVPEPPKPVDHLRLELDLTQIALDVANAVARTMQADNEYLVAENRALRAELEVTDFAARLKMLRLQNTLLGDDIDRMNLVDEIKETEQQMQKAKLKFEEAELALAEVMRKQQGFDMEEN